MKITGKQPVVIEINETELGYAIMQYVVDNYFGGYLGCDWYTKDTKVYYVGGEDWLVSENQHVTVIVDVANILRYGKKFELN